MHKLKKLRDRAYQIQGGECWYCGCNMSQSAGNGASQCTAEHLLARCEGGLDIKENIVAACWFCNSRRHRQKMPMEPDAYRQYVLSQLAKGKWINVACKR